MHNFMKYIYSAGEYFRYKVIAGLFAAIWNDSLPIILLAFFLMECLDIFSAWICIAYQFHKKMYPQTEIGVYKAMLFIPTARRWKQIQSAKLRIGFCDKTIVYTLLIILSFIADGILVLSHSHAIVLPVTATVLTITETLSILENLSLCNVTAIADIKKKLGKKTQQE